MSIWGKQPNKPWTRQEDQQLRELVARGLSHRQIAAELDRPYNGVAGRIWRLKIGGPPERKQRDPGIRNRVKQHRPSPTPEANFLLNGEPLTFAVQDRPCARCAVRESEHHKHGCGQFAAEITVRQR